MGCGHKTSATFNPSKAKSSLPERETLLAGEILQHYYELKDALVATSSTGADQAARKMKVSILHFKKELNSKAGLSTAVLIAPAIQQETDSILIQLDSVLSVKDESCERKRIYFKPLSSLTYRFLKTVDIKNVQVYHQYCPLALNEQSADWLSASPEIENPYFGQKMLTCGVLIDTIK